MTPEQQIEGLNQQIEELKAQVKFRGWLDGKKSEVYRIWEKALRRYANGERGTSIAREALGIGEYWDNGYGKKWMRTRRVWRRWKEWWRGHL